MMPIHKIVVTGESKKVVLSEINITDDFILGEEVVMRVCSALEPEISFNPALLVLFDEKDNPIHVTQPVFAGERLSVHSSKGDPIPFTSRCAVRFADGTLVPVPHSMHSKILIIQWINQNHSRPCDSIIAASEFIYNAVNERVSIGSRKIEILCVLLAETERNTWVQVDLQNNVLRSDCMKTASVQLGLNSDDQRLVFKDGPILEGEHVKFFSKYTTEPVSYDAYLVSGTGYSFDLSVAWFKEPVSVCLTNFSGEETSKVLQKICEIWGLPWNKFEIRDVYTCFVVEIIRPNGHFVLIEKS